MFANMNVCFIFFCFQLARCSLEGDCDGLILENPVCLEEAKLMLAGVKATLRDWQSGNVPLILSFEGALRHMNLSPDPRGKAADAARTVIEAKQDGLNIEALGFSCTEPDTIVEALSTLKG